MKRNLIGLLVVLTGIALMGWRPQPVRDLQAEVGASTPARSFRTLSWVERRPDDKVYHFRLDGEGEYTSSLVHKSGCTIVELTRRAGELDRAYSRKVLDLASLHADAALDPRQEDPRFLECQIELDGVRYKMTPELRAAMDAEIVGWERVSLYKQWNAGGETR